MSKTMVLVFFMVLWYIGTSLGVGTMKIRMDIRIGHGYDLHRLATVEEGGGTMVIGGIPIEAEIGPIAHSDGDAVLHAITDAILSAIGEPDIGQLFPDTDPKYKDADSSTFLVESVQRANEGGWAIGNVDITVICDQPKIGPYREQSCTNIQKIIAAPVNIKGKTREGFGQGKAIEVHVVALVQRGSQA